MTLSANKRPRPVDVAIVGGGIIGLAVARALQGRSPGVNVTVLEAEGDVCRHQTGHNSGVIHSGLYYAPGSLKAVLAVRGAAQMHRFCEEQGLEVRRCGKVVVATSELEEARLVTLLERGVANGVQGLERVGPERLAELQPGVRGTAALWVPGAAITDFSAIGRRLAQRVKDHGGQVRTGARVTGLVREGAEWIVQSTAGELRATYLVGCAGLQSDRLAKSAGRRLAVRIVPFRGEYRTLAPARAQTIARLVYPVPDPELPFLGVHLTPRLDGQVEVGPNAVLALSRHGYRRGDFSLRDTLQTLAWPGFWRMSWRHLRAGIAEEGRSWLRGWTAHDLRRMLPEVEAADLLPGGAGVRAQALRRDGAMVDDFELSEDEAALHVLNAPSPAATASLAIGDEVAGRVLAAMPKR